MDLASCAVPFVHDYQIFQVVWDGIKIIYILQLCILWMGTIYQSNKEYTSYICDHTMLLLSLFSVRGQDKT